MGITVGKITEDIRKHHGISKRIKGVAVTELESSSPAARKGLKKYDIIIKVKVENRPMLKIDDPGDFKKALSRVNTGESVLFQVVRGDNTFFIAMRAD